MSLKIKKEEIEVVGKTKSASTNSSGKNIADYSNITIKKKIPSRAQAGRGNFSNQNGISFQRKGDLKGRKINIDLNNKYIPKSEKKKFKLSIAPHMNKVSIANLSNGLMHEYFRTGEKYKNKEIDISKSGENILTMKDKNGKWVDIKFKDLTRNQKFKIINDFNNKSKNNFERLFSEKKSFRLKNGANIARADGVITFVEADLVIQGASKKKRALAKEEWLDATKKALIKTYREYGLLIQEHRDETNPHFHYQVEPKLLKDKKVEIKRNGKSYIKILMKGSKGSKHIIDDKFLSLDLQKNMRDEFKKKKILNEEIDFDKLDHSELSKQRKSIGINHINKLDNFKVSSNKKKQLQFSREMESKEFRERIKDLTVQERNEEIQAIQLENKRKIDALEYANREEMSRDKKIDIDDK